MPFVYFAIQGFTIWNTSFSFVAGCDWPTWESQTGPAVTTQTHPSLWWWPDLGPVDAWGCPCPCTHSLTPSSCLHPPVSSGRHGHCGCGCAAEYILQEHVQSESDRGRRFVRASVHAWRFGCVLACMAWMGMWRSWHGWGCGGHGMDGDVACMAWMGMWCAWHGWGCGVHGMDGDVACMAWNGDENLGCAGTNLFVQVQASSGSRNR